jgi:hypothetical protein
LITHRHCVVFSNLLLPSWVQMFSTAPCFQTPCYNNVRQLI